MQCKLRENAPNYAQNIHTKPHEGGKVYMKLMKGAIEMGLKFPNFCTSIQVRKIRT